MTAVIHSQDMLVRNSCVGRLQGYDRIRWPRPMATLSDVDRWSMGRPGLQWAISYITRTIKESLNNRLTSNFEAIAQIETKF